MKHMIVWWFDLWDTAISKKIISFQIIMWVFCSKLAIWSWIWCFTAEVKQMSTVTKELYILRLCRSFHVYEGWMNWPDTDSALSLDDYFFNVCEHCIFISLYLHSNSGWSWLAGLKGKKKRWLRDIGPYTHTAWSVKTHLPNNSGSKFLKTHYYSEKWNYQNTNIPCIRSDLQCV